MFALMFPKKIVVMHEHRDKHTHLKLGVNSGLHGLEPGDVRHAPPLPRHQLVAGVLSPEDKQTRREKHI